MLSCHQLLETSPTAVNWFSSPKCYDLYFLVQMLVFMKNRNDLQPVKVHVIQRAVSISLTLGDVLLWWVLNVAEILFLSSLSQDWIWYNTSSLVRCDVWAISLIVNNNFSNKILKISTTEINIWNQIQTINPSVTSSSSSCFSDSPASSCRCPADRTEEVLWLEYAVLWTAREEENPLTDQITAEEETAQDI